MSVNIQVDAREKKTPVASQGTDKLTMAQALNRALNEEMQRDERVLVMGEDVGVDGGVFRITDGLIDTFGPDRVMDTPLAESGIMGTAVGLAVAGFRPVVEIQFMGFIYPAINQLFAHVARMRFRSSGRFTVPMVVRIPYGGGIHPPEHHSESYESLFLNTPGLKVVVPSSPSDAKGLLTEAIRDEDPVVFMEPKRIYRSFREEVSLEPYSIELGKANVVHEGSDVTVIAYGAMIRQAMDARETLERNGVSVEVIDLRSLNPLDIDAVLASASKTGRVVIVHEAPGMVGFGAELSALISERALLHLLAPVERVTGFDTIFPFGTLEHHYLPNRERIVKAVERTLSF